MVGFVGRLDWIEALEGVPAKELGTEAGGSVSHAPSWTPSLVVSRTFVDLLAGHS